MAEGSQHFQSLDASVEVGLLEESRSPLMVDAIKVALIQAQGFAEQFVATIILLR